MLGVLSSRVAAGLCVLALVAAGCSRGDGEASKQAMYPGVTTTQATVVDSATPGSTTTTTRPSTTTTTTTTPPTTSPPITAPPGNRPPEARITSPPHLSSYWADYDPATGRFGVPITFSATVSDPDGDPVTVQWFSSIQGFLGTGANLTVTIYVMNTDANQPFITVRATDKWGQVTEYKIQVIVAIKSDT